MKQSASLFTKDELRLFYQQGLIILFLIAAGLIATTAIFDLSDGDRRLTALFYSSSKTWLLTDSQPWKWFYEFGTIPGLLLTIFGVIVWFLSWFKPQLASWRRYILVFVLTSVLGGGILVNGILKDYWGRTRPRQIQEFDGRWEYLPVYKPGIPGKGKSFPCGHCTMAFLTVSSVFLFRKSKALAVSGTIFGLVYGTMMSVARVGQGGHFPTDTLWALGIVLLASTTLYFFVLKPPLERSVSSKNLTRTQTIGMSFGFLVVIALMLLLFLTRRPVFEDHKHGLSLEGIKQIEVRVNFDWQNITLVPTQRESGSIQTIVRGFGLPDARNRIKIERTKGNNGVFYLNYQLISEGYFSELNYDVFLVVPSHLMDRVIQIPNAKSDL
ncbi:MAG: phosphatase PAP2 family protein [SAR324 cluster bacterium]|nr:phosphatase PAP2 family protein [SAR324 cluster bacterium]